MTHTPLHRQLFTIKPRDVPLRVAARNTAAMLLPLVVGAWLGRLDIGLGIATGALNTMFADQPGPYRLRMKRMSLIALAASLATFSGFLLADSGGWLLIATLVFGFAGGMLVALGPEGARAGMTSMILLVLTAGTSAGQPVSWTEAGAAAALIFAGGVLQMLFAVAAWPLQRYYPERRGLADVCRQLAQYARQSMRRHEEDASLAPPATQALVDVQLLLYGEHSARGAVIESFRVLAEELERVRIELMALADLHSLLPPRSRDRALVRALAHGAARVLRRVGEAVASDGGTESAQQALRLFDGTHAALAAEGKTETGADFDMDTGTLRRRTIALARATDLGGQLRALLRHVEAIGSRGVLRRAEYEESLPQRLQSGGAWPILRANLTLSSVACRHALRCAFCLTLAVACERLSGLEHAYWIPMTAAIVLKPDFGATINFSLWRIGGTLAGLVFVTFLTHYFFDGLAGHFFLLAVLVFAFRILTTRHYGIGVLCLTGAVVILLSFYGIAPGAVIGERALSTLLGSLLGLAIYVAWPSWEHTRVREFLAKLLEAYRDYFVTLAGSGVSARHEARVAARTARTNAQASLDRLRSEPLRDSRLPLLAEGILANANRLVRAAMLLEAALQNGNARDVPCAGCFRLFAAEAGNALSALADGVRGGAMPYVGDLRPTERKFAEEMENYLRRRGKAQGAAAKEKIAADAALAGVLTETCDRVANTVNTIAHLLRQGMEEREEQGMEAGEAPPR